MKDKLENILVDILEVERESINGTMSPDNVGTWDSMNNLKLITMIEGEFEVEFSMDEIESMVDVAGIKDMLNKKGKK